MMVTTDRIDGCADHVNKKPDLISEKHKIITSETYHSQNLTSDSSDDCKTQLGIVVKSYTLVPEESVRQPTKAVNQ